MYSTLCRTGQFADMSDVEHKRVPVQCITGTLGTFMAIYWLLDMNSAAWSVDTLQVLSGLRAVDLPCLTPMANGALTSVTDS